jgi:glycosyltransferase involved in cell wall biosynthesis
MRWIALVPSLDHVCCRYRLRAFAPLLDAGGHVLDLLTWPKDWWGRLRLLHSLRGENVILQRRLLPSWELALLRGTVRRLVFDFDDAVFLRDSYSAAGLYDRRRLRRFAATVRACDAVVAGNPFLRDNVLRFAPRATVAVIPTCVEPARYPLARAEGRCRGLQMVWTGSSSTLQGLELVRPLLEEAGRRVSGTSLKLICNRFLSLDHVEVVPVAWSEETEAAEIAAADVGISWVPDDLWSRGKCGLKVLQYMAAGLPVIANPVGVHRSILRRGETGFLARSPAQWLQAVERLAADAGLRQALGRAGRQRVEKRYSVAVGASRWLRLLEHLAPTQPCQRAGRYYTGEAE